MGIHVAASTAEKEGAMHRHFMAFLALLLGGILVASSQLGWSGAVFAEPVTLRGSGAAEYREVIVPEGTLIPIVLQSHVASDASFLEDPVRARVRTPIVVRGITVIPAGSELTGHVTTAKRSGRVRGVARIGFRFDSLEIEESGRGEAIRTTAVTRYAPTTRRRDAAKIGLPAAGGAIIGAFAGGKKGALIGAAAGGGAGTAVVLSTRGREVRLGPGYRAAVRLLEPLTVRVPIAAASRFDS
jgi:hypothetical protein